MTTLHGWVWLWLVVFYLKYLILSPQTQLGFDTSPQKYRGVSRLLFLKPRFHRWSLAWWQLCRPAATSPPSPAPPDMKVSPYTCAVNVLLWFAGNVKLGILLWWLRWKLQACKIKHHRKKFHNFSTYDNWSTYYCVNKLPEKEKKMSIIKQIFVIFLDWWIQQINQNRFSVAGLINWETLEHKNERKAAVSHTAAHTVPQNCREDVTNTINQPFSGSPTDNATLFISH